MTYLLKTKFLLTRQQFAKNSTKVCLIKFFCDLVNFPFQTRSRVAEICFVKDWIFANDLCPERMMVLKICNFLRT